MICRDFQIVLPIARHQVLLTAFFVVVCAASVKAREPDREFLEGLRLRGYHDVALEYIDRLEKRSDISASLAETLDYERAVTLEMAAADPAADPARSGELLDAAISRLRQFLGSHADHQLAMAARFRLGAMLATRAQLLANSLRWREDPTEARQLAAKARTMFDEAQEIYVSQQQRLRENLLKLPRHVDPVKDSGLIDLRERLRSRYVEVQLLKVGILQKKAEAFAVGSLERLQTLRTAAAEYHSISTKYSTRKAGLYARYYEGLCHRQAGDVDAALAAYKELLDMPGAADSFFDLTTDVLKAALECWFDDDRKNYEQASHYGQRWLEDSSPDRLENSTAIEVLERLAEATRMFADSQTADSDTADRLRRRAAELNQMAQDLRAKLVENGRSDVPPPTEQDAAGDGG